MYPKPVEAILKEYLPHLNLDQDSCLQVGRTIPIPTFDEATLTELCRLAIETLQKQNPIIFLESPLYVIGDIHGNIFDLIRVLVSAQPPPKSRFLFLGDYVDRGQFSVEVVTLLFTLQIAYPEHIYLIRGNHEFESVNSFYGFQNEVTDQYKSKTLYEAFNSVFAWLPLAAIVDQKLFCVHGGLSPQLNTLDQFMQVQRPLKAYETNFVADIVWSDPSEDIDTFETSNRGTGVTFGSTAITNFKHAFKISHIIRAHQCVQRGISKFDGDSVYTVFSCSNYADATGNYCGILFVPRDCRIRAFSLPPLEQIERKKAKLKPILHDNPKSRRSVRSGSMSLSTKLYELKLSKKRYSVVISKPVKESLLYFSSTHRSPSS